MTVCLFVCLSVVFLNIFILLLYSEEGSLFWNVPFLKSKVPHHHLLMRMKNKSYHLLVQYVQTQSPRCTLAPVADGLHFSRILRHSNISYPFCTSRKENQNLEGKPHLCERLNIISLFISLYCANPIFIFPSKLVGLHHH